MTLHDLTTVRQCTWQNCDDPTPGSHFVISSVLCKDGNGSYEQLVHLGEFGSKCLDA